MRHTGGLRHYTYRGTLALLAVLLMAALAPAPAHGYLSTGPATDRSWYWQNPAPQGNALQDTCFVDTDLGWAVGAAGTVLQTTDGGTTWTAVDIGVGTATMRSVYFFDANRGWVVGDSGLIKATTDGGQTWSMQTWPTGLSPRTLNGVDFVSATVGWAVGDGGVILSTINGGSTWTARNSGTTNALYAVDAFGAANVWAVGAQGVVRSSTDGGATWNIVNSRTTEALYGVYMRTGTEVFVVGSAGSIRRTPNGGGAWNTRSSGTAQTLFDIQSADTNNLWVVGTGGTILRSLDSGTSWTSQSSGVTHTLRGLSVRSGSVVRSVGDAGTIVITENAGSTWVLITAGPTGNLADIERAGEGVLYAAGANGRIMRTLNDGVAWHTLISGTAADLEDICFVGFDGWVAGANGVVRTTIDGGNSWSPQASGVAATLHGVGFSSGTHGWLVGDGGTARRTTDGGQSWAAPVSSPGTAANLRAVDVVDDNTAYIVGDGGIILRTTDGGSSWSTLASGVDTALLGVDFYDASNGWVVGVAGIVLRTTDGGETWNPQPTPYGTAVTLYTVSAYDSSAAYAGGSGGAIMRTDDGGATWTTQFSGTTYILRSVTAAGPTRAWVAGDTGSILGAVTTDPVETMATVTPTDPDGRAGWYVNRPVVTLQRNKPGTTYYSWASVSGPWTPYTEPLTTQEGSNVLFYYSTDLNGVSEPVNTLPALQVDTVAPPAPIGLGATEITPSTVTFEWETAVDYAPGSGVAEYGLYRNGSLIATGTEVTLTAENLTPNTEYVFYVTSVDEAGNASEAGVPLVVRTIAEDTSAPFTTVSASPESPDGMNGWYVSAPLVTLVPDPVIASTVYQWRDGEDPTPYSGPFEAPEGANELHYRAVPTDVDRESEPTRTVTFKVDTVAPPAPSIMALPFGLDGAFVYWDDVYDDTSGVDRYDVYLDGELVVSSETTEAIITGITPNVEHYVFVRTRDVAGNESVDSNRMEGLTLESFPPAAPELVVARAVRGNEVFVSWGPPPGEVLGDVTYRVFRSYNAEDYEVVGSVAGYANRSYVDMDVASSSDVYYAVATQDSRGLSSLSTTTGPAAQYSRVTTPRPVAPRGLQAEANASGRITLRWSEALLDNLEGYNVYRAGRSGDAAPTLIAEIRRTGEEEEVLDDEYVDETVTAYRRYWYSVASVDDSAAISPRSSEAYARALSVTSSTTIVPHASFNQPGSDRCKLCHAVHNAQESTALLVATTSRALCETCHDGTGAAAAVTYDLQTGPNPPVHAAGTPSTMCTDCHTPHSSGETSQTARLLDSGGVSADNEFCYTCHGVDSTLSGGDMRVFESSGHNTGVAAREGTQGIVCLTCHTAHGSATAMLLDYVAPDECLRCHSSSSPNPESPDIQSLLTYSDSSGSHHDLLVEDQIANGSRMSCANCHNTHGVTKEYPTVNPYDPSPEGVWTGGENDYCFACHDGTLPTDDDTEPWVAAPLGPGGTSTTSDIKTAYLTINRHGSATTTSGPQYLRSDMGYSAGDILECSRCHEPHGAVNEHNLRGDVRSADGSIVRTGLIGFEIPEDLGGGHDMRFFCVACHDMPDAEHPGIDISNFPIDCTECHTHVGGTL